MVEKIKLKLCRQTVPTAGREKSFTFGFFYAYFENRAERKRKNKTAHLLRKDIMKRLCFLLSVHRNLFGASRVCERFRKHTEGVNNKK